MPKTREEIEALKENWVKDACWDIGSAEGFEAYHDELLAFRKEKEAEWEAEHKNALLCPIISISEPTHLKCWQSGCAWWDENCNQCSVRRLASLVDHADRVEDHEDVMETRRLYEAAR